jgi:hypothetical protein
MRRKNPILLPGKELWNIHFEPLACGRIPTELRKKELSALFSVAKSRGWATPEDCQKWLNNISNLNCQNVWENCQPWVSRLNPKEERDGQAIASWMTLYNIVKYCNLVKSLRPPYRGLRHKEISKLEDSLLKAIEIELIGKEFKHESKRHFLGLLICELCSNKEDWKVQEGKISESWLALVKSLYGKEYYTFRDSIEGSTPWLLTPSHGFLYQGKWLLPNINKVEFKIKELYKPHMFNRYNTLELIYKKLQ